ncbi:MAG: radical SAM protein [Deltaproteobacteria bacterium]|nr:radical SAM protein [Deltaproteobacteria bacterium]
MITNRKKAFRAKDYLAHEEGTIIKRHRGHPSIALVYPNTYFLGMSNLGFQSLYALFNEDDDCVCERVFLPDDLVLDQQSSQTLCSLENNRPVNDFDCVALSISFENDYLNLLPILNQANVPFFANERGEDDPIVLAGGAAITINPEPIRPFLDVFFVGEAEEAAAEIVDVLRQDLKRDAKIQALGKIEGVYIASEVPDLNDQRIAHLPTSICPSHKNKNSLEERVSLAHLRQYKRRVPQDINGFPIQSIIHTPYSEFGKLSLIEVQRGCGRGCKFCAEGFIYTPFRERSFDLIQEQVLRALKYRDKIGLIGADLLVYPEIIELFDFIHKNGGSFSPSSVRVDGMTPEIIKRLAESGHKTMAIAPEAGSEELRQKTNKKFDNAAILDVIDQLLQAGIPNIKMYLMIGLPHERPKDIDDMIELVANAREVLLANAKKSKRMGSLIMSINPFIPKPRTPYQVGVFEGIDPIKEKVSYIKKQLLSKGSLRIYNENPFYAYVQALLSNGTTQMSEFLLEVYHNKGSLKRALKKFTDLKENVA